MAKLFSKKEIVSEQKSVTKLAEYACLMAVVPHDLAQSIVTWGARNIKDRNIYVGNDSNDNSN